MGRQGAVCRCISDALIVGVLVGLVVVPVWPGVHTIDAQAMLRAATEGRISNWYAPVHQAVWGAVDSWGVPPGVVFTAGVVALVVGILATARLALTRRWSWVLTAGLVLWPPVYGLAGWVGRDVWFAAELLGVVALLGLALRSERHRWWWIGAAFGVACVAADARQNGFPVLLVVGGVAGWIWATERRLRRRTLVGALIGVVVAVVVGMGPVVVVQRLIDREQYRPDEMLYLQDLAAMSVRRNEFVVPRAFRRTDDFGAFRAQWVDGQIGALIDGPGRPLRFVIDRSGHARRLRRAWSDAIFRHPFDYAVVRAKLVAQELGVRGRSASLWFGESDRLEWRRSPELAGSFPGLLDVRAGYLDAFDGSPTGTPGSLALPWMYLLAGLFGAALAVAAGSWWRAFGWATLALQVAMQAVLTLMLPLVEYRFEYFQVVLGPVLLVIGLVAWRRSRAGGAVATR